VQVVDVALIMKVLEPIWTTKPETAARIRGRIESVLNWAKARGYRTGENPALWKGHLSNLLPAHSKIAKVKHHAALPYDQTSHFMDALRRQDGVAPLALEFAILTAARTGEMYPHAESGCHRFIFTSTDWCSGDCFTAILENQWLMLHVRLAPQADIGRQFIDVG
jgi:hypothetical protein